MLEHKAVSFRIKEVVDLADGGWQVSGYASTFGGEPDFYGDIVARGAFADSIAARLPKFCYEHGEAIGKTLEIAEDDKGLAGSWSIVNTRAGEDAYRLIKAGVLDSLSIGYMTLEADFREDGVRVLRKVDLMEVSCVAIPANPNALITGYKSRSFGEHTRDVQVALREFLERCKAGSAQRQAEGRLLSDARTSAIKVMSGSLRSVADELDALLVPPPPAERINVGAELRRRRYQAAGLTLERPAS